MEPDPGTSRSDPGAQHIIGSLEQGGAQRMLSNYLAWSSQRHSVLTLTHEGGYFWRAAQAYAPVASLGLRALRRGPSRLRQLPTTLQQLFHLVRTNAEQTQVAWMYRAMVASRWLPAATRRVWMVPEAALGVPHERAATVRDRRAAARVSKRADVIVYSSSATKSQHEGLGFATEHAVVLANGVDTRLFRPDRHARAKVLWELGLPDDAFLVGYVARPHPSKRHALLIEAFNRFRRHCPNAVLLLVGEAPAFGRMRGTIKRPGFVGASIFALGARTDLPKLNAAFDVAMLVSQNEGFPNVLLEAMSCGTAVISTGAGAAPELLAETENVIVEPEVGAIVTALCTVWGRSAAVSAAAAIAGRRRVCQHFSATRYAAQLDAILFPRDGA